MGKTATPEMVEGNSVAVGRNIVSFLRALLFTTLLGSPWVWIIWNRDGTINRIRYQQTFPGVILAVHNPQVTDHLVRNTEGRMQVKAMNQAAYSKTTRPDTLEYIIKTYDGSQNLLNYAQRTAFEHRNLTPEAGIRGFHHILRTTEKGFPGKMSTSWVDILGQLALNPDLKEPLLREMLLEAVRAERFVENFRLAVFISRALLHPNLTRTTVTDAMNTAALIAVKQLLLSLFYLTIPEEERYPAEWYESLYQVAPLTTAREWVDENAGSAATIIHADKWQLYVKHLKAVSTPQPSHTKEKADPLFSQRQVTVRF